MGQSHLNHMVLPVLLVYHKHYRFQFIISFLSSFSVSLNILILLVLHLIYLLKFLDLTSLFYLLILDSLQQSHNTCITNYYVDMDLVQLLNQLFSNVSFVIPLSLFLLKNFSKFTIFFWF